MQTFYDNMGHLDLFETLLCRVLGIEHTSDVAQLPMATLLEAHNLGAFIRPLYLELGCTRVAHVAALTDTHLAGVGMDPHQVRLCSAARLQRRDLIRNTQR